MFQCVKHKKNCKNVSNTHNEGINRGVRYRIRYFIDVYKKRLQGSVNVLQWICSCLSVDLFLPVSEFVPACQWICSRLSVDLFLPVRILPVTYFLPIHVRCVHHLLHPAFSKKNILKYHFVGNSVKAAVSVIKKLGQWIFWLFY